MSNFWFILHMKSRIRVVFHSLSYYSDLLISDLFAFPLIWVWFWHPKLVPMGMAKVVVSCIGCVDDNLVDRKLFEKLLRTSSYQGISSQTQPNRKGKLRSKSLEKKKKTHKLFFKTFFPWFENLVSDLNLVG